MIRIWVDTASGTWGDFESLAILDVEDYFMRQFEDLSDSDIVDLASGTINDGRVHQVYTNYTRTSKDPIVAEADLKRLLDSLADKPEEWMSRANKMVGYTITELRELGLDDQLIHDIVGILHRTTRKADIP